MSKKTITARVSPEIKEVIKELAKLEKTPTGTKSASGLAGELICDGLKYRYPEKGYSIKYAEDLMLADFEEYRRTTKGSKFINFMNEMRPGFSTLPAIGAAILILFIILVILKLFMQSLG